MPLRLLHLLLFGGDGVGRKIFFDFHVIIAYTYQYQEIMEYFRLMRNIISNPEK